MSDEVGTNGNICKIHKKIGGRMYRLNIKRHFGSFQLSLRDFLFREKSSGRDKKKEKVTHVQILFF